MNNAQGIFSTTSKTGVKENLATLLIYDYSSNSRGSVNQKIHQHNDQVGIHGQATIILFWKIPTNRALVSHYIAKKL